MTIIDDAMMELERRALMSGQYTIIEAQQLQRGMLIAELDRERQYRRYQVTDAYVSERGCRGVHVHVKGKGFVWCYDQKAEVLIVI